MQWEEDICTQCTLISLIALEVGINVEGVQKLQSINVEGGLNVGGIFWKKLVHKCKKRGVEGGINLRNQ